MCQALGELVLFLPSVAVGRADGDWGAWAPMWMDLWGSVAHCNYWSRCWLHLFARLAKHDVQGRGFLAQASRLSDMARDQPHNRLRRRIALSMAGEQFPSRLQRRAGASRVRV